MSLSLLPPWHIYERTVSYHILSRGARQVYSSVKRLKGDLTRVRPNYLVCVPLVLDTLHSRVMEKLQKMGAVRRVLALWLVSMAARHVRVRPRLLCDVRDEPSPNAPCTCLRADIIQRHVIFRM